MFSSDSGDALQSHFTKSASGNKSVSSASVSVTQVGEDFAMSASSVSEKGEATLDDAPIHIKHTWFFYSAFASLCIINLVCAIDATILVNALSTISLPNNLNGTAIEAFWAGTSFLLTSTVFQPTWASLSHIIGRKPILLAAMTIFTVGSIICTAAFNFTILLVGRSIQGIGGGGMVALTYVIVSDMWAVGSITGPIVGGAFVEHSGWRGIFILNFPFVAVAFVTIPLFLRLNHKVGSIFMKLKAVDWFGSFLFISSLTSFLVPLTWGGIMYDWNSWRTLVPLILGLVGLMGFMAYSKYISKEPLIRRSIFSTSTAVVGYIGTIIHGIITWSMLYYMPLYYGAVQGYGPVKSGVALFPLTFTTAPAAVFVGVIIARTGRYRPSIYVGWTIVLLGMGVNVLLTDNTNAIQWIFITLVPGTGAGILYAAQSFAVQAGSSNADLPFAAAMYSFFRSFGQTFGVAIGGTIFQNVFKHELLSNPTLAPHAAIWAKDASALVDTVRAMADSNPAKTPLIQAYVDALRMVWIAMCAFAAVALALSVLFIRDISLDRAHETEQGFQHSKTTGAHRTANPDEEMNAASRDSLASP